MEKTEARIIKYQQDNAAVIELNVQRDERDSSALEEDEARERRDREDRAEEIRKQEEEDRLEKEQTKQAIIDQLVCRSLLSRPLRSTTNEPRFSKKLATERCGC